MLSPPLPYTLRPLTISDLPAVVQIEKQSFPSPTKEKVFRYELTENKLAHYQALLEDKNNREFHLIGYAGYWLIADEMHISTIAISRQKRRGGFGELLLMNMLSMAYDHEAAFVTLEVRENNIGAQKLYAKYRFEVVGRRKRYYRDTGEDAILMTVLLQSNPTYPLFLENMGEKLFDRLSSAQS